MSKGHKSMDCAYAEGGAVLGRTTDFMKTPDRFRENKGRHDNFGKGASTANPTPKDKSLTAVKPRS